MVFLLIQGYSLGLASLHLPEYNIGLQHQSVWGGLLVYLLVQQHWLNLMVCSLQSKLGLSWHTGSRCMQELHSLLDHWWPWLESTTLPIINFFLITLFFTFLLLSISVYFIIVLFIIVCSMCQLRSLWILVLCCVSRTSSLYKRWIVMPYQDWLKKTGWKRFKTCKQSTVSVGNKIFARCYQGMGNQVGW